jgi:hypothetical protein
VVLTWPAGGSAGVFQGYNVDRESGEFAVADIKKIIRMVGEAKGVERLHIMRIVAALMCWHRPCSNWASRHTSRSLQSVSVSRSAI